MWAGAAAALLLAVGGWALLENQPDDVILITGPAPDVRLPATSASPPPVARVESLDGGSQVASSATEAGSEARSPEAGLVGEAPETATPDAGPALSADPEVLQTDDESPRAGWVQAVARTFVNVRSAPASDGEVRGVVAENAVVFLGDARGAWRQVRSGDVAGWAWEPLFTLTSGGT
jgi:hypothetical protein